jgi:2-(1,2-epoxy-1,2-dihydrophenyl)acetyl-CoA isomerase
MTTGDVTIEIEGHLANIEFHRPPNNFFDVELITQLADAFDIAQAEPTCRAITLCSEGKNFCAGAKIGGDTGDATKEPGLLYQQGLRLFRCSVPVVAAVQGAAVGGGLGLALVADFRVASPESRFNCNFARLGFHQGFGITVTLPPVIGQQRAHEMLYTGGQMRGEQAKTSGLCDRLVPGVELRDATFAFAREIAASGPLAVAAIRRTMRGDIAERVRLATEREATAQLELVDTEDFAEGVRAMAERRTPKFVGR